jgi:hypothetical protein
MRRFQSAVELLTCVNMVQIEIFLHLNHRIAKPGHACVGDLPSSQSDDGFQLFDKAKGIYTYCLAMRSIIACLKTIHERNRQATHKVPKLQRIRVKTFWM